MQEIKVSNQVIGPIKKINGVGQPPIMFAANSSLFHYLTEAKIPYSRLHDVGGTYGGGRFVDIPNIFPYFDADENDPASYDFAYTDWLLRELHKAGVEPIYRLGVTIENAVEMYASPRIHPPKDFAKWARICEHVIRHYNEGWANGYHFNIQYWEIWNEPDNYSPDRAPINDNPMWQGTAQQFYELYEVTANHLKKCFPHLKIGGYGSCGFYAMTGAQDSPRMCYFVTFMKDFLRWISSDEHRAPLDFFSWHSYAGIEAVRVHAQTCRQILDEHGFTATETQFNEWNPSPRVFGLMKHAAMVGGMLCALQDLPVDTAMFYDARIGLSEYGSLFHPMTREPYADYDAFVMFGRLVGEQVAVQMEEAGVYAVAAREGEKHAMMLVNTNESEKAFALRIENADLNALVCTVTDASRRMEKVECVRDGVLTLGAETMLLIEWQAGIPT